MAKTRKELQIALEGIDGVKKVYFQPTESIRLEYPCIVYSIKNHGFNHANDKKYIGVDKYELVLIQKSYNETLVKSILSMQSCGHDAEYLNDNLYHDAFTIYW